MTKVKTGLKAALSVEKRLTRLEILIAVNILLTIGAFYPKFLAFTSSLSAAVK